LDILDVIKKEHREVAVMLDEVEKCEPGDQRLVTLAKSIEYSLSTHVKIEERLFYSRLKGGAEGEDQLIDMYEAYTEHNVADHVLQLLKRARKPDEKFKAELQVLGEGVKHHVREEESTVFKIARQLLSQDERNKLGDDWAKARQRLDAADRPSRAARPRVKARVQRKVSRKKR
jgi:hemerythrin-like domain-containing protein